MNSHRTSAALSRVHSPTTPSFRPGYGSPAWLWFWGIFGAAWVWFLVGRGGRCCAAAQLRLAERAVMREQEAILGICKASLY